MHTISTPALSAYGSSQNSRAPRVYPEHNEETWECVPGVSRQSTMRKLSAEPVTGDYSSRPEQQLNRMWRQFAGLPDMYSQLGPLEGMVPA